MDLSQAKWRKATRSTNNGGACVELAAAPGIVAVRDSKNSDGPRLTFTRAAFATFTDQVKRA